MSLRRILLALAASLLVAVAFTVQADAKKPEPPPPEPPAPLSNPALAYFGKNPDKINEPYLLYLMTADGSETQQLTSETLGDSEPVWNADGTEIAFLRDTTYGERCSLYSIQPDGTDLTLRYDFCANGPYRPVGSFDWSPDGAFIVYWSDYGGAHLFKLELATGDTEDLLDSADPGWPTAHDPSWSPDGTDRIAYWGAPDGLTPEGIWVLDLSTGASTDLTPGDDEARYPAWSSDGQQIAYFGPDNTLMTMHDDGSDKQVVGAMRDSRQATWSSDDQYLALDNRVTIRNKTSWDLLRVRTDGTDLTNLTESVRFWEFSPDWNPAWENDL